MPRNPTTAAVTGARWSSTTTSAAGPAAAAALPGYSRWLRDTEVVLAGSRAHDGTTVDDAELRAWLEDPANREWYFGDRTNTPPPGQGKFFIKVGSRAGIPFSMEFTPTERRSQIHDTEKKWHEAKNRAAQERGPR